MIIEGRGPFGVKPFSGHLRDDELYMYIDVRSEASDRRSKEGPMLDLEELRIIVAACLASGPLSRGAATPNWTKEAFNLADKLIEEQQRQDQE